MSECHQPLIKESHKFQPRATRHPSRPQHQCSKHLFATTTATTAAAAIIATILLFSMLLQYSTDTTTTTTTITTTTYSPLLAIIGGTSYARSGLSSLFKQASDHHPPSFKRPGAPFYDGERRLRRHILCDVDCPVCGLQGGWKVHSISSQPILLCKACIPPVLVLQGPRHYHHRRYYHQ